MRSFFLKGFKLKCYMLLKVTIINNFISNIPL